MFPRQIEGSCSYIFYILYLCLKYWSDVDGTVLIWMTSHLTNHKQKIKIGDRFSGAFLLPFGISKFLSVTSFFILNTNLLIQVISSFDVTQHLYTDDTQTYLTIDSRDFNSSITGLTECVNSILEWMDGVKLKLNPDKTEVMISFGNNT